MSIKHGILFQLVNTNESKHSNTDFGLVLSSQDISTPDPKTYTVEIQGKDGVLDLTESLSEVKYKNRALKFTFTCVEGLKEWEVRKTQVANFIHGQKAKITTWSDPNYFYIGRCTVDEYGSSKSKGTIVISCDCEPFKYKQTITTVNLVSGANTVNNPRMTVYADLKCTTSTTINNIVYSAGDYLKAIKLSRGNNVINSSGKAVLTYREGEI